LAFNHDVTRRKDDAMRPTTRTFWTTLLPLAASLSLARAGDMKAVLDPGGSFQVLNSSSNVLLHVQPGGSLSIGTASSAGNLHVRSGVDMNYVITGPMSLANGVTIHAVNDAVNLNTGLELRGNPIVMSVGNVGIGTASPVGALHIKRDGGSLYLQSASEAGGADLTWLNEGGGAMWAFSQRPATRDLQLYRNGGADGPVVAFERSTGNVGIGANPATKLHVRVDTDKNLLVRDSVGFGTGQAGVVLQSVNDALNTFEPLSVEASLVLLNPATRGNVGIGTATPQATLDVNGTTRTKVLSITGGADVAEPFAMSGGEIPKGAVVVIDEQHPGQLKLSERAYDKRVAGIVSGAGGVNPGITLSQQGVLDGGRNVALSGRVYALADATDNPIHPGDLLTTSATPGHAMKVTAQHDAQGAILGKAMSRLDQGKGLVLVLVTLQ